VAFIFHDYVYRREARITRASLGADIAERIGKRINHVQVPEIAGRRLRRGELHRVSEMTCEGPFPDHLVLDLAP
jgi:hypothetical protein